MPTSRVTRSSVLGKRSHQPSSPCEHIIPNGPLTPEESPNPKRLRIYTTALDGDSNKENVPPFRGEFSNNLSPTTPRSARSVISHLTLATPPPTPISILPIHARARALLRPLSNTSAQVAGRDQERTRIQEFIDSFLGHETLDYKEATTTLYISGSPGTGKTALVDSILRGIDVDSTMAKIVTINCMALNGIDALWDRLLEELETGKKRTTVGRAKKIKGRKAVDVVLSGLHSKW
jgi:cell division control protein 6